MFDLEEFLADLRTLVGFETVVCRNPEEFRQANAWIRGFFSGLDVEFVDFECHGLTTTIVKPVGSSRPNIVGDGHLEVVPGPDELFELREEEGVLYGRGVADMKTQCLTMMYVLRHLLEEGDPNDFWLVFSEDEEVGSQYGVSLVADHLAERDLMPPVVFAPDGGPDFSYVEKEKGILTFEATVDGAAAHASRPWLGCNAIDGAMDFYDRLRREFPHPAGEDDWRASLSMTTISAEGARNQIPDRCVAGFDLRLTEAQDPEELAARIRELASEVESAVDGSTENRGASGDGRKSVAGEPGDEIGWRVSLEFESSGPATHYPKEAPVAREFLSILERVSGREPRILHSAGASNGRIYVEADPDVHVLMSSPAMGGAHAAGECVALDSLEPYFRLVHETARLDVRELCG